MLTCRVCGKPYEPCYSIKMGSSVFNWREVACSPECGATYFKQIEESRAESAEKVNPTAVNEEAKDILNN